MKTKIWNGIGEKLGEGSKCKSRGLIILTLKYLFVILLHSSLSNLLVNLSLKKSVNLFLVRRVIFCLFLTSMSLSIPLKAAKTGSEGYK
jgi:hypothetical protein